MLKDKRIACEGCRRLEVLASGKKKLRAITNYVHTGRYIVSSPALSQEDLETKLESRIRAMRRRSKRPINDSRSFVTAEQLRDLIITNEYRCKALNAQTFFHPTSSTTIPF